MKNLIKAEFLAPELLKRFEWILEPLGVLAFIVAMLFCAFNSLDKTNRAPLDCNRIENRNECDAQAVLEGHREKSVVVTLKTMKGAVIFAA